jgi:hypothetical protein
VDKKAGHKKVVAGQKPLSTAKCFDHNLDWIPKEYPSLLPWRELALEWLKSRRKYGTHTLDALAILFRDYIHAHGLPVDPAVFLHRSTDLPDFQQNIGRTDKRALMIGNTVYHFLDFVLEARCSSPGPNGKPVVGEGYRNPITRRSPKTKGALIEGPLGMQKLSDPSFALVMSKYPQLEPWRLWAVDYIKGQHKGLHQRLYAMGIFLERYLVKLGLPTDPHVFFHKSTVLPDFHAVVCLPTEGGVLVNNRVHEFLDYVLLQAFSIRDDYDHPVILPEFRNPVPRVSSSGLIRREESVLSPLPYGYIDSLRRILASGPNFQDWKWAQEVFGGVFKSRSPDWFPVTEDQIDRNDPDCVWRIRERDRNLGAVLEMWSPVRWVAILVKLILPLRSFQVRVLDSGEADTYRYEGGEWVRNRGPLAEGTERKPHNQGVLRRMATPDGKVSTCLYINTNKTADAMLSGKDKGYTLAWPRIEGTPIHRDVHYWLEKLRNWQEKFNPIQHRTPWTALDARHSALKSEVQLAGFPDTCFLFRTAEGLTKETMLPVTDSNLGRPWHHLLQALERQLAAAGETHPNGAPILFVPQDPDVNHVATNFPLHSLRVSLITALALEGQVPFPILMKIAGHSRILMTLYYTKPGHAHVQQAIEEAQRRLEEGKDKGILDWLQNTEYERLVKETVCVDPSALKLAIPSRPEDRSPSGWMDMGYGWCLAGGNMGEVEGNRRGGGWARVGFGR